MSMIGVKAPTMIGIMEPPRSDDSGVSDGVCR